VSYIVNKSITGPVRGPGHYSDDQRRWWDERLGRWLDLQQRCDLLEIEIEEGVSPSVRSVVTAMATPSGTCRFVGVARSDDLRWPVYRVPGAAFQVSTGFSAGLPSPDMWSPSMINGLQDLRAELVSLGWIATGRGSDPWSFRYVRPCAQDG
jgi:hypothetical protein